MSTPSAAGVLKSPTSSLMTSAVGMIRALMRIPGREPADPELLFGRRPRLAVGPNFYARAALDRAPRDERRVTRCKARERRALIATRHDEENLLYVCEPIGRHTHRRAAIRTQHGNGEPAARRRQVGR